MYVVILIVVIVANVIAIMPASRLSDRIGRKPVIWAACAVGAAGLAIVALAPVDPGRPGRRGAVRRRERAPSSPVDWALMTDIIPRVVRRPVHGHEQRGDRRGDADLDRHRRHRAGPRDLAPARRRSSPRVVFILGVVVFALAAVTLRPVVEPSGRGRARRGCLSPGGVGRLTCSVADLGPGGHRPRVGGASASGRVDASSRPRKRPPQAQEPARARARLSARAGVGRGTPAEPSDRRARARWHATRPPTRPAGGTRTGRARRHHHGTADQMNTR